MALLKLSELVKWFGLTVFEIWMQTVAVLLFTVLLTVKVELAGNTMSWWAVFSPLLGVCGLQAYFVLIVLVRHFLEEGSIRAPLSRALVSCIGVTLIATFEVLLCWCLEGLNQSFGIVFIPVFLLMGLLLVKACTLHQ